MITGVVEIPTKFFSAPPSLAPTFLKMDILGALDMGFFAIIFAFLFVDLFDTAGTLVGVSNQAGLFKENRLPVGRSCAHCGFIGHHVRSGFGYFHGHLLRGIHRRCGHRRAHRDDCRHRCRVVSAGALLFPAGGSFRLGVSDHFSRFDHRRGADGLQPERD